MLRCTGERLYGDGVQRWRGGLPVPPAGHRAEADWRELQVSPHGIKLDFFPIRIQAVAESGSSPDSDQDLLWQDFEEICKKKQVKYCILFVKPLLRTIRLFKNEFSSILPFLGDNFGLPGSRFGFQIQIRIRWSNEIRIHSVFGLETLNKTQAGNE